MRQSLHLPPGDAADFPTAVHPTAAMTDAGLVLGDGSVLIRMSTDKGVRRLSIDTDHDRFAALMSIVGDRPLASDALRHIKAADRFWRGGDKALANLRLIFADLPRLAAICDVHRLTLAAHLLDEGMAPDALTTELGLELATKVLKYAPGQAHVPAGHGEQSGQFTSGRESGGGPAARIVLAMEDEDPAHDQEALQHQGESVLTPSKGPARLLHAPLIPSPPPVSILPRLGGAETESKPNPEEKPAQHRSPLIMEGPPPSTDPPLPPGVGPGKYADKWVPAGPSKAPSPAQQDAVTEIGKETGCHTCGTRESGLPSGKFICDHQRPNKLNPLGATQYYLPHCLSCSNKQGGRVRHLRCESPD